MIQGRLFTRDFLHEGIAATSQWAALNKAALDGLRSRAESLITKITATKNPSEAVTEKDLIYPLLNAIGWGDNVYVQLNVSVKGRDDVPDALLFADTAAHDRAREESDDWKRFQHGLCVVEAKRWNRVLDREEKGVRPDPGVPSTQMLRYLRRVDDLTKGGLRWGILTNGRMWRLYWQGALSVAEDFLEIDLGKVLNLPGCELDLLDKKPDRFCDDAAWRDHTFKLFVLLFGRSAFLPFERGNSFHAYAVKEGKFWEARVAKTLSEKIFEVFPALADALAKADPQSKSGLSAVYIDEVRQGALILLYRLLFVLYAEDRNLLPDDRGAYADYCLTRMRLEIADKKAAGGTFPTSFVTYWPKLGSIFRAIANGDDAMGIPPYNGGLFEPDAAPILERTQLPDAVVADVLFGLSHEKDDGSGRGPKYINYRDLSVQQLGAVYELILEFGLRATPTGHLENDADEGARHKSGSYYTPEALVSLIIARAVSPLVEERFAAFKRRAAMLASDHRSTAARLKELAQLDPAVAILSLRICDPAMGSGHFLVSLVDWLSDEVLGAMAEAAALVPWGIYVSPLAARIAVVREKILREAETHKWPIVQSQLDDRHVVRRMVLKRVVYGVDKNPMAVELAKVALWLHSFTVGAPLSFLDHHLRDGDSVLGAWVRPTVDALETRGALFNRGQITRVEQVASLMAEIEETTDNDIAEVTSSKAKFGVVEEATRPIAELFSLLTAEKLMAVFEDAPARVRETVDALKRAGAPSKAIERARMAEQAFARAAALEAILEGTFGDPIRIASGEHSIAPMREQIESSPRDESELPTPDEQLSLPGIGADLRRQLIADNLVQEATALKQDHRFLHWEIAFPNVWSNLLSRQPEGGFDAVIGNPPYVRQELLGEQVKRALKKVYITFDGMADLYVYFYEQGLRLLRPGGRMGYVVTNKWLKADYAGELRNLFATKGWVEFVADFGHARHFFPDADVFPSVVVVRKPDPAIEAPEQANVSVIPRDAVPKKDLLGAIADATFQLPRAVLMRETWALEPKPVMDLLEKVRSSGVPLAEYARAKPLYGIKTGLNEAFLVDAQTRERLVREDPACADIIKPYLRGQDIERWWSPESALFMIVLKSSGDHPWPWANASDEIQAEAVFAATFPSLHSHMKSFESWRDHNKKRDVGLRHREDQGRFWWELRSCTYYDAFERPKVLYVDIAWSASFSLDRSGRFTNNTAYFIPSGDPWIAAVLNAPIGWWFAWRKAQHGKDEALRYFTSFVEEYPIPSAPADTSMSEVVGAIEQRKRELKSSDEGIVDWLRHEFDLKQRSTALATSHILDGEAFAAAVRKALPKSTKLSAADIARIKQEHQHTVEPARRSAIELLALEKKLSDLVNTAYGLTPEDVALMWATAPPRMPLESLA